MRVEEIEEKAFQLLKDYNCLETPINIKSLIKKLGIKLSPYDLGEDVSGVLVIDRGNHKIGYNSTESLVRQRFTLAHEVGHFILHCNDKNEGLFVDHTKYMFRKGSPNSKEYRLEMQANQFAAALLMPEKLINREVAYLNAEYEFISDHDLIERLAKTFKVSEISMTYRLNNLGYFHSF